MFHTVSHDGIKQGHGHGKYPGAIWVGIKVKGRARRAEEEWVWRAKEMN